MQIPTKTPYKTLQKRDENQGFHLEGFSFRDFYEALKQRRFVIYPGKVTGADTFRIGNIGHVFSEDIQQLLLAVKEVVDETTS